MFRFPLLFFFVLFTSISVKSQNLEKVLVAHFEAVGQEVLMSHRSLLMEIREVDHRGRGKKYDIIKKLPSRVKIKGTWQANTYVKAYDGVRAWTIAPWTGVFIPQLMTDEEETELLLEVAFGSPLYAYKGLDQELTMMGTRIVAEEHFYVVRLTVPSGYYVDYLIGKKTNLIERRYAYKGNTEEIAEERIYKDYKNVGGCMVSFETEVRNGNIRKDISVDNLLLGYGIASSAFSMPESED